MYKKYLIPTIALFVILIISYFIYIWVDSKIEAKELELSGNVDIRQVELAFRVSGRIQEMRFEEGDTVTAGAIMAVLDKVPYENDLALAQGQHGQAAANFAKMQHGSRPQEIEQARATLAEQQAAFVNADALFKRNQNLVQTGAIAKQDFDNSLASKNEAQAALEVAQETLDLRLAGFRIEDIDAARAQLQAADAQVAIAQTNLSDTNIIAPHDGFIFTRIREPGAIVAAGTPVYTLSLTQPVWVRAYIAEPDLGKVKPGMQAQVYTDSSHEPLTGQIGYISPQAEFTPKNIETKELRTDLVYRIRITVDDPQGQLRQGMPVSVKIKLAEKNG